MASFKQEETQQKVIGIIEQRLNLSAGSVYLTNTLKDLGADSLDIVELIMTLEEEFGIEITDEKATALESVGDVVSFVHEMRSK
jgi:acyl carrier protein